MSGADSLELAKRLIDAIVAGDVKAVREIYAPDATIWHNYDQREQTVEENLAVLRWLTKNVTELRYEDIRRQRTDTGFLQQHVLRGKTRSGRTLELPACLICRVENGRITRLEEYFDSAHLAPLSEGGEVLGSGD